MVWVIRPKLLFSCPTKMVHIRIDIHKDSGTTSRSTSLKIWLIIEHYTQRYSRLRKT